MASSKSAKKRRQAQRRQQLQDEQVRAVEQARESDARRAAEAISAAAPGEIVSTASPPPSFDPVAALEDDGVLGVTTVRAGAVNWVILIAVVLVLVALAAWLLTRTPT